jgi:peptide/nickel transport system substrate-binding protein
VRLSPPVGEDEEAGESDTPDILLRGETAGLAIARFAEDEADLVTGGTVGDLPIARAAGLPGNRLVFDPAPGLFGLAFAAAEEGPLADPAVRPRAQHGDRPPGHGCRLGRARNATAGDPCAGDR